MSDCLSFIYNCVQWCLIGSIPAPGTKKEAALLRQLLFSLISFLLLLVKS